MPLPDHCPTCDGPAIELREDGEGNIVATRYRAVADTREEIEADAAAVYKKYDQFDHEDPHLAAEAAAGAVRQKALTRIFKGGPNGPCETCGRQPLVAAGATRHGYVLAMRIMQSKIWINCDDEERAAVEFFLSAVKEP